MKENRPFIKKFKTDKNYYIYDVNTNNILRVDKIVWDLVDFVQEFFRDEILNRWTDMYKIEDIIKALDNIYLSMEKENLFSATRPKEIKFPLSKLEIIERLNKSIDQITLEVTEQCNLRCYYCVYSGMFPLKRVHSNKSMNWGIARKAIDFYIAHSQENSTPAITFYGGEPLLNFPLIEECILYAKEKVKRKIHFGITTNGTLINDNIINFSIKNDCRLTISLDGPREIHDRYRRTIRGQQTFDMIMSNIEKIRRVSLEYFSTKVGFNVVLSPPFDLEKTKYFFDSHEIFKYTDIRVGFVKKEESSLFHNEFIKSDLYEQLYQLKKEFKFRLINNSNNSLFLRALFERDLLKIYKRGVFERIGDFHPPNGICIPGHRKLFVNTEGNFYICESTDGFRPIGNVNEGINYQKALDLIDIYSSLCNVDCLNCWLIRLCDLCFVSAIAGNELNLDKKRKKCEHQKKRFEETIKFCLEVLEENPKAFDYLKDTVII